MNRNMIIAIGTTAVVTMVITTTPFLIIDHLRKRRARRNAPSCSSTYAGPL